MSRYYITTAIDYVNNLPHLGTAYEKIGADCFARYRRLCGDEVTFLMGTDEHSQKVAEAAEARGLDPHAYCDQMAASFQEIWQRLRLSYDDFIQTTSKRHVETVRALLGRIHEAGDIYKGTYAGYYDVNAEAWISEQDHEKLQAAGEAERVKWVEEEVYYFRLSKYAEPLAAHFEAQPDFVVPDRWFNEVKSVLDGGLRDLCISRSTTTWGIPLPFDEQMVAYVWFDALINYVTAAGFSDDPAKLEATWPADVHVIGKDITRFHCLVWPAMLMSAGLALPKQVLVHGFVYFKGKKISKSEGDQKVYLSALDAVDVVGSVDALRYYLLRHVAYGSDGDFTWERLIDAYNSELANDLGNLANRARTLISKDLAGTVRRPAATEDALAKEVEETALATLATYHEQLRAYRPDKALDAVWELVRLGNRYVTETEPWKLAKGGDAERELLEGVLYRLAELLRFVSVMIAPAMPNKAHMLWGSLGLDGGPDDDGLGGIEAWGGPDAFSAVERGQALFPKVDFKKAGLMLEDDGDEAAKVQPKQQKKKKAKQEPEGPPAEITIDDVFKLDLRVATITAAKKVEKADKLLEIALELADGETRTIISGVAKHYTCEDLVGKQIVLVYNLKPRKTFGVLSQGMLLAADGADGAVVLVSPEGPVPAGARVG